MNEFKTEEVVKAFFKMGCAEEDIKVLPIEVKEITHTHEGVNVLVTIPSDVFIKLEEQTHMAALVVANNGQFERNYYE